MAKDDKAVHKTAVSLLALIRNEDNRRRVQKAFGLEAEPEVPPSLTSLLDAIEKARKGHRG